MGSFPCLPPWEFQKGSLSLPPPPFPPSLAFLPIPYYSILPPLLRLFLSLAAGHPFFFRIYPTKGRGVDIYIY